MPNSEYEKMSVAQLTARSNGLKEKIMELQEERRAIAQVRNMKIEEERVLDAIKAAGLEGKVIVPAPAVLSAEGH